jgi:F-type H+-transporting ATPase subunit delta
LAVIAGTGEQGFAARYAAALYALASEQGVLSQTIDEVAALGVLLAQDADLSRLVNSPFTDTAKIAPILSEALAAQGVSILVRNFVNVAVANRRLRDLSKIIDGFSRHVAAKRGEVVVDVTTAEKLTDSQRQALFARLTESGYGNAKLLEHVDPSLLGGMTLKIGTKLYDTSLKSRLNRLNYSLKGVA